MQYVALVSGTPGGRSGGRFGRWELLTKREARAPQGANIHMSKPPADAPFAGRAGGKGMQAWVPALQELDLLGTSRA